MRIWTYKNADEKAHTFSRKSKKRSKTAEKRILRKFTFTSQINSRAPSNHFRDLPSLDPWLSASRMHKEYSNSVLLCVQRVSFPLCFRACNICGQYPGHQKFFQGVRRLITATVFRRKLGEDQKQRSSLLIGLGYGLDAGEGQHK